MHFLFPTLAAVFQLEMIVKEQECKLFDIHLFYLIHTIKVKVTTVNYVVKPL